MIGCKRSLRYTPHFEEKTAMATASAVATRPIRPIPSGSNPKPQAAQAQKQKPREINPVDREVGLLLARANNIVYASTLGQYLMIEDEPGGYAALVAATFTSLDSRQV